MEEFDAVKWWGAIIGTAAFGWNVYNTMTNSPNIKVRLRSNIAYQDGRVVSEGKNEFGEFKELATYCHIELINVGKQSATLTNIEVTNKKKAGVAMTIGRECFQSHSEEKFPLFIQPGRLWSCRLEMEELKRIAELGTPEIRVTVSYKDKPIVVKPKI